MGDLTLAPEQRAVLELEERLRKLAPSLGYADMFDLALTLTTLRKAVGLPALMVCAPARPCAEGEVPVRMETKR